MAHPFKPATAEELAARGVVPAPEGTPEPEVEKPVRKRKGKALAALDNQLQLDLEQQESS